MSQTVALPGGAHPSVNADVPGRTVPVWASTLLTVTTFLLVTIHTAPFADLRSVANIEVREAGNRLTQIAYILVFGAAALLMARVGYRRFAPLAIPSFLVLAGWIGVSTVLSQVPLTSARRLILTLICVFLAAALLLIARSLSHFARTLAITALCVLVFSYVSIALVPDYTLHTTFDLREPHLAGNWRGPFNHKNEAGAVMVLFVLIGGLAYVTTGRLLGAAVMALALVFLLFTQSKTAIVLLPLIAIQAGLARWFTGTAARVAILLGPLALLGLISLGSLVLEPVQVLVAQALTDTSFTGRTEIWEFTLDNILKHPIIGWGYGGFWRTEETQYATWGTQTWIAQTDQAHNAYLDTALFMGLPGLALTLLAFVLVPLRDVIRSGRGRRLDAAATFFVALWLYALHTAFFESVLYEGNSAIFLLFMLGIFGLRLRTVAPVVVR